MVMFRKYGGHRICPCLATIIWWWNGAICIWEVFMIISWNGPNAAISCWKKLIHLALVAHTITIQTQIPSSPFRLLVRSEFRYWQHPIIAFPQMDIISKFHGQKIRMGILFCMECALYWCRVKLYEEKGKTT